MLLRGIGFLSTSHFFSLLGPEINLSLLKKKKKKKKNKKKMLLRNRPMCNVVLCSRRKMWL